MNLNITSNISVNCTNALREKASFVRSADEQDLTEMQKWSIDIIRGKRSEHIGTVDAPSQREAYRLAIEKFDIPIERRGRLFVVKLDDKQ